MVRAGIRAPVGCTNIGQLLSTGVEGLFVSRAGPGNIDLLRVLKDGLVMVSGHQGLIPGVQESETNLRLGKWPDSHALSYSVIALFEDPSWDKGGTHCFMHPMSP